MIWIPFVGALSEATIAILEKKVLRKRRISHSTFIILAFFAAIILSLPLLYFFWEVRNGALEFRNVVIFCFIIGASTIANLFAFYALKWENLSELEPVRLLQPLFVILLAFIFFSSERNVLFLLLALVASFALVFSHIRKHHFEFNKYLIAALLSGLFYALELVASNIILSYYSIFTFYFLRCTGIFLIAILIFKPDFKGVDTKIKKMIFVIGALWVFYRLVLYYGYIVYGVIFTTLLFILAPVFIYLFARIFLKEKLTWRNIVASIIIVLCVLTAILIRG